MLIRIILASLVGGALAFGGGFVEHMQLKWVGRHYKKPTSDTPLRDAMKANLPEPGVYFIPTITKDLSEMTKEEQEAANENYKQGPSGLLVLAPAGENMMDEKTLGMEFASNVAAAFLAAVVVAMTRPSIGFFGRWLVVIIMGLFSWVSVNASYHIWYRYPLPYVQDELYCALLEWAAAGVAIALIVRPRERGYGY